MIGFERQSPQSANQSAINNQQSTMLGLYVHIPFCSAICNYCNFNRGLFDAALKTRYVEALISEIERAGAPAAMPSRGHGEPRRGISVSSRRGRGPAADEDESPRAAADTIYFGGGTPSLLEPEEIGRIIGACRAAFDVADDSEITLEANPESVDQARLARFRGAGVNRLSFGVQSLREPELRRLSRLHTVDRAREAVAEARAAGFDNLSLDLMMWLPGQQVTEWLESVDAAIALDPEHLSLYLLEVYPNAPLRDEMARARWSQAPDEDAAAMYVTAMERLEAAGYEQYEISNVGRPGRRSRHNVKYWSDGEWLGFGCGAHSTRRGVRWKNVASTEDYARRLECAESPAIDHRSLSAEERLGDALFTGLRLTDGVNLDVTREVYGVDVWARYGAELEPFLQAGLLKREGARMWLTRQGMLLAHEVMTIFV
jgi:oxygen-independent coproporphyrinogen-3 oxidase